MTCPVRSLITLVISKKIFRAAGTYFAKLTLKLDDSSVEFVPVLPGKKKTGSLTRYLVQRHQFLTNSPQEFYIVLYT